MTKRSPKEPKRERLDISLTTIFEGDACKAVCINNPHLSIGRIIELGKAFEYLGCLLDDKARYQKKADEYSKKVCNLMYGREL